MGLFDLVTEVRDKKEIIKIIIAAGYEKTYYIKKYGSCSGKVSLL